jgi:hypothetical protein
VLILQLTNFHLLSKLVLSYFVITLFSLSSLCFAQGVSANSGKKITFHNRDGLDRATGGLEIFAEPVSADVYINGKLAGITPLTLEKVVTGSYEVRIKAKGYSEYRTHIDIIHDQFTVVNVTLSRAHHIAWQQSRTVAIQSSMLIPGKGQVDLGYSRGWTFFFGFAAAGWYGYYQFHKNEDERDKFNEAKAAYAIAENPESASVEYGRMMSARDNMSTHQQQYEYAWLAMGGVWAINMFDVLFVAGREPVINAFGLGMRITPEITPTYFTLKLWF